MNLPILWAQTMLNGELPADTEKELKPGFTAMVEPIDYQKRVIDRNYDLNKWYKDFKNAKCKYYFNENALKPFFVMLENNNKLR